MLNPVKAFTLVALGLVVAAFAAFLNHRTTITAPLFAQSQAVPSIVDAAPSPQHAAAVERARQLVRTAIVEQNLPGVSVAVGIGLPSVASANEGAVVWAEGFGWRDVLARAPVTPDTRFNIGTAASAVTDSVAPLGLTDTGADPVADWSPSHLGEPEDDFPLFTLIRDVIFRPMGLAPDQPLPGNRATFYVPRSDDNPLRGRREMYMRDMECCPNRMAFYSTPSDLVRFALATNPGSVNGELAGGTVMSLTTRRDGGIAIAVTSNMAYANTSSLALRIGEAFAEQAREPASKAAAILTWPAAKREQYIAALDSFFLTRTVKAGPRARVLDRGRALVAFEAGGSRADAFNRFTAAQRVRGVLVLHDGKIRLERYVAPHSPTTRWNSFSVAKSITSTLVGAAMKDGAIRSLDDPVTRYISALRGSAYDEVTVRQLLTMTSGVKWNEDYTDVTSDVARMYAQPPDPGFDMTVSYVRKLPREAPPGSKWVYKTSETNLVGVLVAEATGKQLADYLSEKIWRSYGMERDAEWMVDDVGHEQGGCCLAMTLRDYGRFGQFILDGARVNGAPIVPETWLPEATRTQAATGAASGYGYQWWTRDDGTFEGRGIYGQTLHIDRARRLVIVINSATEQPTGRESGQARQEFMAAVNAELDAERR